METLSRGVPTIVELILFLAGVGLGAVVCRCVFLIWKERVGQHPYNPQAERDTTKRCIIVDRCFNCPKCNENPNPPKPFQIWMCCPGAYQPCRPLDAPNCVNSIPEWCPLPTQSFFKPEQAERDIEQLKKAIVEVLDTGFKSSERDMMLVMDRIEAWEKGELRQGSEEHEFDDYKDMRNPNGHPDKLVESQVTSEPTTLRW